MNQDWDYLPFSKLCVAYILHFLYTVMCELDTGVKCFLGFSSLILGPQSTNTQNHFWHQIHILR
jgi:hypothetical protein